MKIALVAPLIESVPPQLYGGTERVVSCLANELVRKNHDVTLYASGDSTTTARLISIIDRAIRLNPHSRDPLALHLLQLERISRDLGDYDLIHFHTDYLHFPLARHWTATQVTTLHGRLDLPELGRIFSEYSEMPVISISDHQRLPLPMANWQGTVHNGIDETPYLFHPDAGRYLAFLGRICPEKGIEEAIEIAHRSGMELKIAAKIDNVDRAYYEEKIKHLFDHPLIDFIGEIRESEKSDFLGNAAALLFPIRWPEPFGLVMIESLACGTPVIAFGCGSVPEVLRHGVTGFIVDSVNEALSAIPRLALISRQRCRQIFDERFSASIMTEGYLDIYRQLLARKLIPRKAA